MREPGLPVCEQALGRICETLGQLVNGPSVATAILINSPGGVEVRCHYGFGSAGIRDNIIPLSHGIVQECAGGRLTLLSSGHMLGAVQVMLETGDAGFGVVENRCGERRIRLAFREDVHEVVEAASTA